MAPTDATNASSGDTDAEAGQASTGIDNGQVSAAVAGGGQGAVTAANTHTSNVVDSSSALAGSGVSVVLAATPAAGAPAPSGVTTAHSGAASAAGVDAANTVHNTAIQGVSVGGANNAPVSVASHADVGVADTGLTDAQSGAAWAVGAGASGGPSNVATPVPSGQSTSSTPVSATGLQATNTITDATSANVTLTSNPTSTAVVKIAPTQVATVVAVGVAVANSGAVCANPTCPGEAAAKPTTGAAQAASGAATASGLAAQNTVNTNAAVTVHVAGQNYAPITVIVNSITQIFNWGLGSATSGDAQASGGSTGTAAPSLSSGAATATGAQVQNTVDMHSSAAVQVNGDNYNPINIVLSLAANLVNWGIGVASSGDAQATGGGGGSASSGSASANGLLVANVVNMWADASVDIEGNNYAPIFVEINFKTNIDNRGYAQANTGNVAAGAPVAAAASTSADAAGAPSSSHAISSSHASSGNASAHGTVSDSAIASSQVSSANGGHSVNTSNIVNMLRQLPSGSFNPFVEQNVTQSTAAAVVAGLDSRSGDSSAQGLHSTMVETNTQIAACSDPGVPCVASNVAKNNLVVQDVPGRTGNTGTNADSGFSGVDATPTPHPSGKVSPSSSSRQTSGSHRTSTFRSETIATDLAADGHMVVVDLFDNWPGRRLPPMPNMQLNGPVTTTVNASLGGGFPNADELPLPDLDTQVAGATTGAPRTGITRPLPPRVGVDTAAEPDTDEYPPLVIIDVDLWSRWPAAEALPMPAQVLAETTTVAAEPATSVQMVPEAAPPSSDDGAMPVESGLDALLSSAFGALVGLKRGRALLVMLLALAWPKPATRRWLRLQSLRGLTVLRLMLGILRTW